MIFAYRFGPSIEGDCVRFRLWAPDATDVEVEVENIGEATLEDSGEGWKEARLNCGAGARYRFRIGDTYFADPASRQQQGGVHGWSIVRASCENPSTCAWHGRPWNTTVFYELHAGLMGGFAGVSKALERLVGIGITAIELMPIAAFRGERNWGYDGVLPFAPAESYGSPEALRALIDQAHAAGVMVFLDVVYNHFGPDGNYLSLYAKRFFRQDVTTPWGAAIDFRQPEVRRFFTENALYWIHEFGFDGLRFDAVHAIRDEGFLPELAASIHASVPDRKVHLVVENDDNETAYLRHGFDAQWNDDLHHAMHVLLTRELKSYYRDFASAPAEKLARALSQGFVYQGEASANRDGKTRGTPSKDLGPRSFVSFLQNHDQIGNRAFGERLTELANPDALKAAIALLLLSPQIPLIFMGEEVGSRTPFLYFTDHGPELARAVREGRKREFGGLLDAREKMALPDPNASATFKASDPFRDTPDAEAWRSLYHGLLGIRHAWIAPHIEAARSLGANAVGESAVIARWKLGNGGLLTLASNLGDGSLAVDLPDAPSIWGSPYGGIMPGRTTYAWLSVP